MEENKENFVDKKGKRDKRIIYIIVSAVLILIVVGFIVYAQIISDSKCNVSYSIPNDNFDEYVVRKPIIYLYPEQIIQLTVKLENSEKLTCSYPEYTNGWNVIAEPDGTLTDLDTGRKLYSLYWEGINTKEPEMKEGFVVKGSEIIPFLEEKLEILGLNYKEAEEFIVYWLPKLQENEWNYIRFATLEEINENMPLEFSVEPDSLIRVLMEFKGLDEYIEIPEQKLDTPERSGFVVVEWGGTELE